MKKTSQEEAKKQSQQIKKKVKLKTINTETLDKKYCVKYEKRKRGGKIEYCVNCPFSKMFRVPQLDNELICICIARTVLAYKDTIIELEEEEESEK